MCLIALGETCHDRVPIAGKRTQRGLYHSILLLNVYGIPIHPGLFVARYYNIPARRKLLFLYSFVADFFPDVFFAFLLTRSTHGIPMVVEKNK